MNFIKLPEVTRSNDYFFTIFLIQWTQAEKFHLKPFIFNEITRCHHIMARCTVKLNHFYTNKHINKAMMSTILAYCGGSLILD